MRPVIDPRELHDLRNSTAGEGPAVVLLDVRWGLGTGADHEAYRAGHLPGAVFLDLDRDLAAAPGRAGRHPLPDPAALARVLGDAGVTPADTVVAYDAADGSVAARLWWLLRWVGHDDVAILDGGYRGWVRAGFPVSTDVPEPPAAPPYPVRPGAMPTLTADAAAALARTGLLLDARAAPRYRGETEPVDPRPGHIPGAHNAPFAELTDAESRWRTGSDLAGVLARWGVGSAAAADAVGAYCGSGVTACTLVLAGELAGRAEPVALYPGSWSEWSSDPDRPAATGPEPG